LFVLGRIALARQDADAAERRLRTLVASGKDGYEIRLLRAHAAAARRDDRTMARELREAVRIDPERAEAYQGLVSVAERSSDAALLLESLRALVRIDQHDREASARLLSLLGEQEAWDEVLRYGADALFLDPHNGELHRLLGQAYLQAGKAAEALFELDSALLTEPEAPAPIHVSRARALATLGRRTD